MQLFDTVLSQKHGAVLHHTLRGRAYAVIALACGGVATNCNSACYMADLGNSEIWNDNRALAHRASPRLFRRFFGQTYKHKIEFAICWCYGNWRLLRYILGQDRGSWRKYCNSWKYPHTIQQATELCRFVEIGDLSLTNLNALLRVVGKYSYYFVEDSTPQFNAIFVSFALRHKYLRLVRTIFKYWCGGAESRVATAVYASVSSYNHKNLAFLMKHLALNADEEIHVLARVITEEFVAKTHYLRTILYNLRTRFSRLLAAQIYQKILIWIGVRMQAGARKTKHEQLLAACIK